MSPSNFRRVPKGIATGGQFAASAHQEASVRLAEYAKPLEYPPGARAMVTGQMGTISGEPDEHGRLYINMDDGGCIVTKPDNVVNWDAYLDVDMPTLAPGPYHTGTDVRPKYADKLLQRQLVFTRDASAPRTDSYFAGRAQATAEVAAALLNHDADSGMIRSGGAALRDVDMDELYGPDTVKNYTVPGPLTEKRSRQLAGHFIIQAIATHTAMAQFDGDQRSELTGRRNAYVEAAVRLDSKNYEGPSYMDMTGRALTSLTLGEGDPNRIMEDARE